MIRLETFFTTNLILDKPNFLNSFANTAFSPLQHMPFCGQKQYQSLNGRITPLAETSPAFWGTPLKTSLFFLLAIVATIPAMIARLVSLSSSDVCNAFKSIMITKIKDDVARMSLIMTLPPALQRPILEQLKQMEKTEQLKTYLRPAISYLERLKRASVFWDSAKGEQQYLPATKAPDYLHPFAFAKRLQALPSYLVPQEELLQFNTLLAFCSEKLKTFEIVEEPLQDQIKALETEIKASFTENARFILRMGKIPQDNIAQWLSEQKAKPDYPYPFYLVPLLLPVMESLKLPNLEAFKKAYNQRTEALQKSNLSSYLTDTPPDDHPKTLNVKQLIARLQNIWELQRFFDSFASPLPLSDPPD